jgi:hypothetical protein
MTTKSDTTLHELPELNDKQLAAVDALTVGATDQEAADQSGVHRVTVTNWRNRNPVFQAALNARRAELWSTSLDRLRSMLPKALDRVEEEIMGGDAPQGLRAALKVLEIAGMGTAGGSHYGSRGVSPEDPEAMIAAKAKAKRPSPLDELLADLSDGGPVTDEERRRVIAELKEKGAFD